MHVSSCSSSDKDRREMFDQYMLDEYRLNRIYVTEVYSWKGINRWKDYLKNLVYMIFLI